MRALALAAALWLAVSPAQAQISLLGLQNSLVQFALSRISTPGELEITADGVQEGEDGRTELAGVRVADGRGVWLEIDAVGLRWNPTRILRGELEINRLFARGVRLLRRPDPAGVAIEATGPEVESPPFSWPRAPIATRVEEMTLEGVEIAAGVIAAQSLAFDATGAARDEGNEQAAQLTLRRTDAVEGAIALDYLRDFRAGTLRLQVNADEAAGGVAGELAGFPPDSAVRMVVDADGPLDDWAVRFDAEAERVFVAGGEAQVVVGPPLSVAATFQVVPGPAMDPQIAAALGERASLVARVAEDADGVIRIEQGAVRAPDLTLDASGFFARQTGALDLDVALEARAGLAPLVPGADFERIAFDGTVSGALDDLAANGALALAGLRTEPVDVGAARLDVAVTVAGPVIGFSLSGDTEGLRLDRLTPETVGPARLVAEGRWDGAVADLATLSLQSALLSASVSGRIDVAGDAASVAYEAAAPDLAAIAAAYGADAAGEFAVEGRLEGPLTGPRLTGSAALTGLRWEAETLGAVRLTHDATFGDVSEGTARLEVDGSRFGPGRIAAGFRLEGSRLDLRDFDAFVLGVAAAGAATVDLDTLLTEGVVSARIADLAPLSELAGDPVQGAAELTATLSVTEGAQDAALVGVVSDFSGFDARVGGVDLDVALRDALGPSARGEGRLSLRDVAAAGAEIGSLGFEGAAEDLRGAPAARGVLTAERLAYAPAEARVAALRFEGSGADLLADPSASGVLTAEGVEAAGASIGALRLEADGEGLLVARAVRGVLTAERLAYPAAEAQVARLRFEGSGADLLADPAASGVLTAEGVAAAGARVGALRLEADGEGLLEARAVRGVLSAERLAYPAAEAQAARLRVEGSGTDLLAAPQGAATVTAEGLAAAGFATPRAQADAALDAAGRLTARLRAEPGSLGDTRLGPLALDAAVDGAVVDGAPGPEPVIDATATLGPTAAPPLSLRAARLTARGPLSAIETTLDAQGAVGDADLSVALRARMDAAAAAPVIDVATLEAAVGEAQARLRRPLRVTAGESVTLEGLDLALPGGGLRGDATLHPNGASGSLTLQLDDVTPLARIADAPLASGALTAQTRFDTRAGSASATLSAQASGLKPAGVAFDLGGFDLDAQGRWDGRRAALDAAVAGPFAQPLTFTVATPLVPTGGPLPAIPAGAGIDGRLRWQGRIGDLWTLVPTADHVLDGDVAIDLGFAGAPGSPRLSGDVRLSDGRYENLEIGTILTDVAAASRVEPDGAFAVTLTAQDGAGGPVRAEARFGGGGLDARISADGAVLVRRDDVTASITADLTAQGPLDGLALAGTVTVDRAEARLVNTTPPSVASLGEVRIKGEPIVPPRDPGAGAVALDLTVRAPETIFVRGRGLDSQWRMDLRVTGDSARPQVVGAIERVRGQLALAGATFDLARGTIRFTGGQPIDPSIDVALLRDAEGVRGGVVVRGFASAPEIAFESQPQLPEGEVLPRVLFGKSQQSLDASEAIQIATGLATLLDGSGGALDRLRATAGLDVLRLEGIGEEATVTVGSRVADGVFVGAKQPLDGGSARVTVEIEVFPSVTVDTEVGTGAGGSVGLNWRREF